ncbi:hypothetical protein [Streptomyces reticuli]|uniref:hypothetical protein n=1 Tax=Streptomyces reticuli TaxID=1926 RepID=UPI00073DDBB1|nr:hypothetical protein TUE45_pSRTUE45a_0037 [Streptomyces reticuli]
MPTSPATKGFGDRRERAGYLARYPDAYRTGLVRRRALDLYQSIPAQHHEEAAVRELREVLAA